MFNLEEALRKLPELPGVYLMKDSEDHIIYVGKAINLKNRVRQYFQSHRNHSIKVQKMVEHITSFEYIIVQSEVEALVLECNLIKKYTPKYNIALKDSKTYPYIKITLQEAFPRLLIVRQVKKDGAKYFGPYTQRTALNEVLDLIYATWPLRTCRRNLPKDIGKERCCLNGHIGKCKAPCEGRILQEAYREMIHEVIHFLSGHYQDIIKKLQEEMMRASEALDFERAALLRDQIKAIEQLEQKQIVTQGDTTLNQDVIAFARNDTDTLLQVYYVRQGKLVGREHFYFKDSVSDSIEEVYRSFIMQFYADANFIPKEIVVERVPTEIESLKIYLSDKKGSKVNLFKPQKGVKHGLLTLASKNASLTLNQMSQQLEREQARTIGALEALKEVLGLEQLPNRIEAYDISNTSGVQSVGGMVVFEAGKPKKSDYRKFKIKSIEGPNDYGSLEEVLERRFARLKRGENQEEGSFSKIPDLILMDGGKGQVHSAEKVMRAYQLNIPICGMVKDDKHHTRGLWYNDKEILLDMHSECFKFVTRVQDEVHRFAITYHRQVRGKALLEK